MDPDGNTTTFLIAVLLLVLANALLTAGRTALTVLKDSSIKKLAASGDRKATFISKLLEKPAAFLEGLKLAGFSCTVVSSVLAFFYLAMPFIFALAAKGGPGFFYPAAAAGCILVIFTLNVLCLLLPYRIACRYPQPVAFALAGFCRAAALLMRPFVALNSAIASGLAALFGVRAEEEPDEVTEEEIRLMVDVGKEKGAIEQSEKDMINNIFEFDDRSISEVMTHRTDMVAVPKTVTLDELSAIAIDTGYSRIPVYDDDIDDIIGIVYVKDLLCLIGKHDTGFDVQKYMRSAYFVPENMDCVNLFTQFKQQKVQVAVAVDEYGGTAGIVSMEDLLESIVGNIQDEYDDEEEEISKLSEGCYSIDGTVGIDEVERLFDTTLEEEESEYDTIGGLLTEQLERIPAPDEHPSVTIGGVQFTVLLVEDRRIARIRAERIPAQEESSAKEKEQK
ncbi:hemolysin family protein [Anaerotruncus rubiinfantis]|uniref:hemolysin family protein n=1 Tax=Anaerotruncus rubiinfantis TaxID=1720200 RepID=UPI00082D2AF2|nr:hemolysin family protein [Anaerotruncus rubiinfantis]